MSELAPNFVVVTLGVSDLNRSIAFYEGMGWERRGDPAHGIVWFRTTGPWLGVIEAEGLAADAGMTPAALPAFRGITLAVNLASESEVDAAVATVRALGGDVVKEPTSAEWGGYLSYFADPDGHLWELCYNPTFPLDEQGHIEIP